MGHDHRYPEKSDIHREDHHLIFRHIGQLIVASKPADVITVFGSLKSVDKASDVGGLIWIILKVQIQDWQEIEGFGVN
jgi:replicative DNA helicase